MAASETMIERAADAIMRRRIEPNFYGVDKDNVCLYDTDKELAKAALTAALSDQAGGWQDISTAPRNNSAVLVYCPLKTITFIATAFWDTVAEEWRLAWTGIANSPSKIINPTHWQPLPAPPPSSTAGESQSG